MRYDVKEGDLLPSNSFLYGKRDNNWYVIIRLKWWTEVKNVIDPYTFLPYTTSCYLNFLAVYRKQRLYKTKAWIPVDGWNKLRETQEKITHG